MGQKILGCDFLVQSGSDFQNLPYGWAQIQAHCTEIHHFLTIRVCLCRAAAAAVEVAGGRSENQLWKMALKKAPEKPEQGKGVGKSGALSSPIST